VGIRSGEELNPNDIPNIPSSSMSQEKIFEYGFAIPYKGIKRYPIS
jgi:hypothetical protein